MRKAMIAGALALAGYGAGGGQSAETAGYQVTVYLQNQKIAEPLLLDRAKALTTSMFAGIGVHLRWELGASRPARDCHALPDAEIVIRFASKTPAVFYPGALAYSRPFARPSEVRVIILYERAVGAVQEYPDADVARLSHVLAHEMTHVLQGVARHSETGLMKAQWTPEDRAQMRKGPLPFTPQDAELIREGMASSKCAVVIVAR